MAKFELRVAEKDKIIPGDGGVPMTIPGRVFLVPLDDAAKITQKAGEALRAGVWTPEDPKEREKASKRLAIAHTKEDVRRGIVEKDEYDQRVEFLQKTMYKLQ